MTEKRQFPKFDFDYFDNNRLDNSSQVMQMFGGKNKRVARVFNHNDDDDESEGEQRDPEKSYGLHLVSAEAISGITPLPPTEPPPEIVDKTANNEILKTPNAIPKNNRSLPRTLFQQPKVADNKTPRKKLICSTPYNGRADGRQESFFNFTQAPALSPIRSNSSIASSSSQRGINKMNPPRKQESKSSQAPPASTVHNSGGKRASKLSQQEQSMEISETINNYRKSQLMRLSRCDQTNLNSVQIVETPVANRRKTAHCDAKLAKKLQRCESSPDSDLLTNDESAEKEAILQQKLPEIHEKELKPASETDAQESAVVEVVFKPPEPIKEKTKKNEVIASSSMESTQVSASAVEYINSLRKSINEAPPAKAPAPSHEPPPPQTRRFSIPKRTRAKKKLIPKVDLITLAKKSKAIRKKSEIKGRKRTLYSQHSFSEQQEAATLSQQQVPTTARDSPDLELAETVAEIRRSLSHCSSTTTVFNGEITTPEKRGKERASKSNTEQSSEENSKQDEASYASQNNLQDAPEAPHTNAGGKERARVSSTKTKTRAVTSNESLESQMPQQDEVATAPAAEAATKAKAPEKRPNKGGTKKKTTRKNPKRRVSDEYLPQTESDDEADHEMQEVASKNPRSTRKAAFKRIHPADSDDDDEPPTQRARGNEQQVESDDESEKSKDDDEGFESDGVPRPWNFKYDPNETCPRKGLRVRKFPTAWWRHDAEAEKYGLVYSCYSRSDTRKEQEAKALMRKYNLNPLRVLSQGLAPGSINPDDALRQANNIVEKKKKSAAKSSKRARTTKTMTAIPENMDEEAAVEVNIMKSLDAARENNEAESVSKSTEYYDIHQVRRLEWTPCGPEMFFHQFSHKKSDGFIKFLPGARKSTAKTKQSELKFVLLCGKIDFTINDEKETLENVGYITIKPRGKYSVSNPYDEDAILSFTKFDPETADSST